MKAACWNRFGGDEARKKMNREKNLNRNNEDFRSSKMRHDKNANESIGEMLI